MAPAANIAVLVLVASAAYLVAGRSWSGPHLAAIGLHLLAGMASAVLWLTYVPGHVSQKTGGAAARRPGRGRGAAWAALFLVATVAAAVYPPTLAAILAGAAAFTVVHGIRQRPLAGAAPDAREEPMGEEGSTSAGHSGRLDLRRPEVTAAALIASEILLFLLVATWFTGLPLLAVLHGPAPRWIIRVHRLVGEAAALAFLAHVLPSALRAVRRRPSPGTDRTTLKWLAGAGGALAVAALAAFLFEASTARRAPTYTARLSTIPTDDALPRGQARLAGRERELLALTGSCGKSKGCHQSLVEDFERSAHLVSVRAPHFAKNMDLMAGEIGRERTLLCAGCHVPVDALAGDTAFTTVDRAHRGNSCAFCHSLSDAWVDPTDKRRSFFSVSPRYAHLAIIDWADADRAGWRARLSRAALRLNIAGHGRALMRPFYREDRVCDACHHLQTPAPPPGRFVNPRCADCHMQSERYLRASGRAANHYFPGSNSALPYILGDEKSLDDVLKWLRGDLPLPLKGWGAFWQLRGRSEDDPSRSVWLRMAAEILPAAGPEAGAKLRITTANVGMAHRFPAAALDLLEVWQQVEVENTRTGELVFERGRLDPRRDIDPEAHQLGGYMLDAEGHMIERNRVWRIERKVVTRAIEANGQVVDDYDLPPGVASADEIQVRAWWNYRFMNRPYTEWAYGEDFELPIARIGDLDVHFRMNGLRAGEHRPPASSARGQL